MKLIYCPLCHDVIRLRDHLRQCDCGRSSGQYTNGARAIYMGHAIPLGIINHSLRHAAIHQSDTERLELQAFVMPKQTENFRPSPEMPPIIPRLPPAPADDI